MNYQRVNLLKKSEQRYQGAVSRRFLLVSIVATPILLIAVLSGIKLIQYTGVQSELKASREIWKTLEPKLALFNEQKKGLADHRQILSLFEGWRASQASVIDLLDGIQDSVPENLQFTRLSLRSDLTRAVYAKAEDMTLNYKLVIEGLSQGNMAESDVIRLQRELLACEVVESTFDSIKLTAMRKRQNEKQIAMREFRLEGSMQQGGVK
jgi:hypothetical protein